MTDAAILRVRHVARAICRSRTFEGIECCQWPANLDRAHTCPVERGQYDDAATDAIEALEIWRAQEARETVGS